MDSPQSVVSSFKSSVVPDHEQQQQPNFFTVDSIPSCTIKETNLNNSSMGSLQVYIHQARDIHNICIYHKQDVYAKLCLTSDPDNYVSSKIINGGGRNPVFNDNVELKVHKFDTSLKCEIWMMSRVKNYLEDQLLGFALVPLSEVIAKNGKLEKEFSLSSSDLFHSPSGFVKLSLEYAGTSPEIMDITAPVTADAAETVESEMDKIEFPDPKIANENELMVSEYFGITASDSSENEFDSEENLVQIPKIDSPPSSVSTNGVSSADNENPLPTDSEDSCVTKPVEKKVVQQDFVDMYMKSMQQFTESLAKMKLPLDVGDTNSTSSGNSSSDLNSTTPKSNRSRVFYGSRAFF